MPVITHSQRHNATAPEADSIVQEQVVEHERDDEGSLYPQIATFLKERYGLSAMSRAHREILHLARLLARIVEDLPSARIDRFLLRDARRVIEATEALVRIHTAQEDDIYTPSREGRHRGSVDGVTGRAGKQAARSLRR
jgi:Hemerythrin HHE cation binding domain